MGVFSKAAAREEPPTKMRGIVSSSSADKETQIQLAKQVLNLSRKVAQLEAIVIESHSVQAGNPLAKAAIQQIADFKEEQKGKDREQQLAMGPMDVRTWDQMVEVYLDTLKKIPEASRSMQCKEQIGKLAEYQIYMGEKGLWGMEDEIKMCFAKRAYDSQNTKLRFSIVRGTNSDLVYQYIKNELTQDKVGHRRLRGSEPQNQLERQLQTCESKQTARSLISSFSRDELKQMISDHGIHMPRNVAMRHLAFGTPTNNQLVEILLLRLWEG